MDQPPPAHLAPHYKVLGLPVGAPYDQVAAQFKRLNAKLSGRNARHNGVAAHKFRPKLETAFYSIKRAHFNPQAAQTQSAHPLSNVENARDQSVETVAAANTTQNVLETATSKRGWRRNVLNAGREPALNPQPSYMPSSWPMHQPKSVQAPGFALRYKQKSMFDDAEDRAVYVREF
jgi:hypothetical protein